MSRGLIIIIVVFVLVCITSALRVAPGRCSTSVTGTCKPGGKCREGSYCSSIKLGLAGRRLCCRSKPRNLCQWGSTGKCTKRNKKCDNDSSCRFPLLTKTRRRSPFGECCRDRPVMNRPGNLCQWGSTGKCTKRNKKCDNDSSCRFPLLTKTRRRSPFGECCRDRPVMNRPVCRWGSVGRCGGNRKYPTKCQPGSSCKKDMQGDGHCCKDRPTDNVCKHGSTGVCGKGLAKCRKGSTCRIPKPPFPGRPVNLGRCCRDKPIIVPPKHRGKKVCPPSSGLPSICVVLPNSCLTDKQCRTDELCCDEGCGKVCKKAVTLPVLKLPTAYRR